MLHLPYASIHEKGYLDKRVISKGRIQIYNFFSSFFLIIPEARCLDGTYHVVHTKQ